MIIRMDTERIGWPQVVRLGRDRRGWTQEQLARESAVALKTVGNLENGTVEPQRGTLGKIQRALGLSSDIAVAQRQASGELEMPLYGLHISAVGLAELPPQTGADELDRYLLRLEERVSRIESRLRSDDDDASSQLEGEDEAPGKRTPLGRRARQQSASKKRQ